MIAREATKQKSRLSADRSRFVEPHNFAARFQHLSSRFQIITTITMRLAPSQSEFSLHLPALPIQSKQWQSKSTLGSAQLHLQNLAFVCQQTTGTTGFVLKPATGSLPWLDIAAVEEKLSPFNASKGICYIDLAGADRLDLGSTQLHPTLKTLAHLIITPRLFIGGDHLDIRPWFHRPRHNPCWMVEVNLSRARTGNEQLKLLVSRRSMLQKDQKTFSIRSLHAIATSPQ